MDAEGTVADHPLDGPPLLAAVGWGELANPELRTILNHATTAKGLAE